MIRAGIYCRVSTDEQAKNGISLQCQQDALTKYATEHQYEIIDYYIDDGYTGTNLKRPGLQRLLNDVKSKKLDIVLITKLDRWGRGVRNYYKVDEILNSNNVHWKTILENYDTTTSAGKLYINIMLSIAENESATTSDRIKFVFQEKLKKKEPVSFGRMTLGLKVVNKKVVRNEETAHIAEDVFKTIVATQSRRMTRIIINERYSLSLSDQVIRRMITNEIYIGIYRGSGLVIEDFCEPLISKELFYQAQEVNNNLVKMYSTDRTKVRDYIFSGLITCKHCGKKLSGRTGGPVSRDPDRKRVAYVCSIYRSKGACQNTHTISEQKIELELLSKLRYKIEDLKNELTIAGIQETVIEKPKIDRSKIKNKIDNLLSLYLDGHITKEIYMKKYSNLLTLLEESDKEIKETKSSFDINLIENLLQAPIEERYLRMDKKERRRFWRSIVKEITYDKDKNIDFKLKIDEYSLSNC